VTVDPRPEPALSVVLATDRVETIERVLAALRSQTASDRIELVLVSLSGEPLDLEAHDLQVFASRLVVVPETPLTLAEGRAAGVRAAGAPFVHIGETHAFPRPDWAATLIASLGGEWAAVVSGLGNANPGSVISWSNLIVDYGPWLDHLPAGEITRVPPYNTAFERRFALAALARGDDVFSPSFDVSAVLRTGGHRIMFQPAATLDHVNVSVARHWLAQRYVAAYVRTAERSQDWRRGRRLAYVLGGPLIPAVLSARLVQPFLAARRTGQLPRLTAVAILLGVIAVACGEIAAFARGVSPEKARRADTFELHKCDFATGYA
jgi:hypothetical protein